VYEEKKLKMTNRMAQVMNRRQQRWKIEVGVVGQLDNQLRRHEKRKLDLNFVKGRQLCQEFIAAALS
jgi:hypothetical protein